MHFRAKKADRINGVTPLRFEIDTSRLCCDSKEILEVLNDAVRFYAGEISLTNTQLRDLTDLVVKVDHLKGFKLKRRDSIDGMTGLLVETETTRNCEDDKQFLMALNDVVLAQASKCHLIIKNPLIQ